MKLFTKILMAAGLLTLGTSWADTCTRNLPNELDTPRYMRTICLAQDRKFPGPTIPLDPDHSLAVAAGLLTPDQALNLDNDAIIDLKAKYGIDFSNVPPDVATGVRVIPGVATFLPTIEGLNKDFFFVLDTEATNRGADWYMVNPAVIVLFTGTNTIPGGTYAGGTYYAGYLYSFGYFNLLKNNSNINLPPNREVIAFASSQLSPHTKGMWNFDQYTVILDVIDSYGHVGLYSDTNVVVLDPEGTGQPVLKGRPVMTWVCPN